ncbi:uncharacterized protein TNCV_1585481 [Trichonephila clavipes]|nr:uncharacterized protein TNCV_1585481 [Trichonephila clavipes]
MTYITWKTPPSHNWYQQNGPGAVLELKGDRKLQTAITRLISGHTRGLTFVQGRKTFPVCSPGFIGAFAVPFPMA